VAGERPDRWAVSPSARRQMKACPGGSNDPVKPYTRGRMSPSEQTNQHTRDEWRDLGFYYGFDETPARWRLVGSRSGLLHFRDLLIAYANDPRNQQLSEHEHYGPYFYLTIRTWSESTITAEGIIGTLADIRRLAQLFEEKLRRTPIGGVFSIDTEYASNNAAILFCEIQVDGFDPASADPLLHESTS
jgi:hypothetical protein